MISRAQPSWRSMCATTKSATDVATPTNRQQDRAAKATADRRAAPNKSVGVWPKWRRVEHELPTALTETVAKLRELQWSANAQRRRP
eukprot:11973738-Alexandrium_andersonii.AAC.1